MKAPIDKIKAGGNDTIQVVITTACDRLCSNCTQLLPFRKDYKFMSVECFTEAVLAVKDWPGIVALFGGNPCVHPKFPEFCTILSEHIPPERRGLWTNNVFKHGEIAKATFSKGRLNLNAHADPEAARNMDRYFPGRVIRGSESRPAWHSGILLDYRDFGISEAEFVAARETCDINQKWSGAIVERDGRPYFYFCEVAAALDGIRGENHGVLATPGVWKLAMPAFENQVRRCCDRGCGVPLRTKGKLDADEIYDISMSYIPLTQDASPEVSVEVHHTLPQHTHEATDYMSYRVPKKTPVTV